jgi:hypothetical protein
LGVDGPTGAPDFRWLTRKLAFLAGVVPATRPVFLEFLFFESGGLWEGIELAMDSPWTAGSRGGNRSIDGRLLDKETLQVSVGWR